MENDSNIRQKQQIYLLFKGDSAEGRLVLATTSKTRLREAVVTMIHQGEVTGYYDEDGKNILAPHIRTRQFRKDWKELSRCELNDRLEGVYLGVADNGTFL